MKSTVINTSKEMMAYSDFPPSKEFPNFMHNTQVMQYFKQYAERFGLFPYIRFNTLVKAVTRTDDYEETGRWHIDVVNGDGKEERVTVDGVLLCSGHHVHPYVPSFADQNTYKGEILHSHSYKDHRGFEDKRVVVVGVGNSGGDIAVELSRICQQVYLVTRRGTWVFYRVHDYGHPLDCAISTRANSAFQNRLPGLASHIATKKINERFDHANYGLKPAHGPFQAHPTVNDDLANRILCGTIQIKPNIARFHETGVTFEDGTKVENIDRVILCTGYSFGFPYLEEGIIPVIENRVRLFKYMYPPQLRHPSLSVVGLIQPLGAIMPISELQCRVFCQVMSGGAKLPSKTIMEMDITAKETEMAERYVTSRRHTIQVDYIQYMDELAEMIGVRPQISKYWIKDPKLAWTLFFGPCAPYQYRLEGPHPWPGARDAILTLWDRVFYATKTRKLPEDDRTKAEGVKRVAVLVLVAILVYLFVSYVF